MESRPRIWNTPLHRTELAHAFHQQVFWGHLNLAQARSAWRDFEEDLSSGIWIVTQFPERAWSRSVTLAAKHGPEFGVRALDSLHVACALELGAERFWTFDERQRRLAEAAGLDTRA